MPEDSLLLACSASADKLDWLLALQAAIKRSLQPDTSEDASRSSPPLSRQASYTFTKLANLKDVTYKGNL